MNPDAVIGGAFVVVFVTYGVALVQRLKAYRAAVKEAEADLERRRAVGLSTADAERAYDETAEAFNTVLERFPSNLIARALAMKPVPTLLPPVDGTHAP